MSAHSSTTRKALLSHGFNKYLSSSSIRTWYAFLALSFALMTCVAAAL